MRTDAYRSLHALGLSPGRALGWALGLSLCGAPACQRPPAPPPEAAAAEPFGLLTIPELEARMAAARAGTLALSIYDNNAAERFAQGHLPGARWVMYDAVTARDLPADKDTTLVFYCASEQCSASHQAARAAVRLGHRNVFILPAGIFGWERARKPIEKGA